MIRMCSEVIKNLGPFMIIYATGVLGACLGYYSDSNNPYTFLEIFINMYSLSYGQFNNSSDTKLQTFVLIITTLVLTLVLLNLIIALMGDIYEQVKSATDIADKEEMASIIIEIDSMMFFYWRKGKSTRKYIQQCWLVESKIIENDEKMENDKILNLIGSIEQKQRVAEEKMESILASFEKIDGNTTENENGKVFELLSEIKNDIKDTKKEFRLGMMKTKLDVAEIRKQVLNVKGK